MAAFTRSCLLPVPVEEAVGWHLRPGALLRLTPGWLGVRFPQPPPPPADGARVTAELRWAGIPFRWTVEYGECDPSRGFWDRQIEGPFAFWQHWHRFEPAGEEEPGGALQTDSIDFRMPCGPAGRLLEGPVLGQLERLFRWRHERTRADLERHARWGDRPRMRVAVTGATGLIGSQLCAFLTTGGHTVHRVSRSAPPPGSTDIQWDPSAGQLDPNSLEGLDAVVHLAGEPIAERRWTPEHKERVRRSRVDGARLLAETIARLKRPPRVFVSASAIGYYGNRGDESLDESSPPGSGFLAEVCLEWEAAADPARAAGIRTVHPRIGTVLDPAGGALAKMLLPFRLGLGGPLGDGRQQMSWVSLDDLVYLLHHCLMDEELSGPVNATAPNPVTNREFARTLGRVLRRPAFLPLPAFAIRLLFGEMGQALLLDGARVLPNRALSAGFEFRRPGLEEALRFALGR